MPLFVNRECSSSYDERIMGFVGRHTLDVYLIHYFFITTLDVMNDWLRDIYSVTSIKFSRLYRFCPWIAHANLLAKYHRATVHYSK